MSRFRPLIAFVVALLFWQSRPAPPNAAEEKRLFTRRRRSERFQPSGATQSINLDAPAISAEGMTPLQLLDFERKWHTLTTSDLRGKIISFTNCAI